MVMVIEFTRFEFRACSAKSKSAKPLKTMKRRWMLLGLLSGKRSEIETHEALGLCKFQVESPAFDQPQRDNHRKHAESYPDQLL